MKKGSLALRVLAISICFFALPLLIYSLVIFRQTIHTDLILTINRLRDLGRSRARILELLNDFDYETLSIAENLLHSHENPSQILSSIVEGGPFQNAYYISIMPGGRLICTASSDSTAIGEDFGKYGFMKSVLKNGRGTFLTFGEDRLFRYHLTARVVYGEEKPVGILIVSTRAETLLGALLQTSKGEYPVNFSLLTEDGVIFASGSPKLGLRTLSPLTEEQRQQLKVNHNFPLEDLREGSFAFEPIEEVDGALYFTYLGQRHIGVVVPVEGTEFSLLLDADVEAVFGSAYRSIRHAWILFGIIIVVGGLVTFLMTRQMGGPLRRLVGTMQRVAEGDLAARFKPSPMGFEINRLGEIFNETLEKMKKNIGKAEELQIATDIQMNLLPSKRVEYPGVEILARFVPAKEVGGDFYDIYPKEKSLAITVADAADKGISACLYSFSLRSILRSYLAEYDSPAQIFERANRVFYADAEESSMFVTAFMAIYHPESHTLTYSSCGHLPGILRRADGTIEVLEQEQLALGLRLDEKITEASIQVADGDMLVLYTDGLTDAIGHEGLIEAVKSLPPEQLLDKAEQQLDDTTIAILRFGKNP